MGPLPESEGNKYILLIGDQFSKWYETVALPNQEAQTVSRAFIENWILRFGCPVNLHRDQGSNFISILFCSLCSELGIQRTSTTSHHPQRKALIERTNRTIKERLSKYIGENEHEWTKFLPLAMMAYRSTNDSVSKCSPAYVLLEFPLSITTDFIYSTPQTAIHATPSDYNFTMKQKLQETHQLMREYMVVKQERQKTNYDSSRYRPSYKVVREVLVFNTAVKKGETRKTTSFCRGPYIIVETRNDLNFRLEDKKTRKFIKVHYDRLKNIKHEKSHSRLRLRRNEKQHLRSKIIPIWTAQTMMI